MRRLPDALQELRDDVLDGSRDVRGGTAGHAREAAWWQARDTAGYPAGQAARRQAGEPRHPRTGPGHGLHLHRLHRHRGCSAGNPRQVSCRGERLQVADEPVLPTVRQGEVHRAGGGSGVHQATDHANRVLPCSGSDDRDGAEQQRRECRLVEEAVGVGARAGLVRSVLGVVLRAVVGVAGARCVGGVGALAVQGLARGLGTPLPLSAPAAASAPAVAPASAVAPAGGSVLVRRVGGGAVHDGRDPVHPRAHVLRRVLVTGCRALHGAAQCVQLAQGRRHADDEPFQTAPARGIGRDALGEGPGQRRDAAPADHLSDEETVGREPAVVTVALICLPARCAPATAPLSRSCGSWRRGLGRVMRHSALPRGGAEAGRCGLQRWPGDGLVRDVGGSTDVTPDDHRA